MSKRKITNKDKIKTLILVEVSKLKQNEKTNRRALVNKLKHTPHYVGRILWEMGQENLITVEQGKYGGIYPNYFNLSLGDALRIVIKKKIKPVIQDSYSTMLNNLYPSGVYLARTELSASFKGRKL